MKIRAKYQYALIIIVSIGLLQFCQKYKKKEYFDGVITEVGSWKAIEGATVILKYWRENSNDIHFDSATTDLDGKFNINVEKKPKTNYILITRDKLHFWDARDCNNQSTIYVSLNAFAFLKIRVTKTGNVSNSITFDSADNFGSFVISKTTPYDSTINLVKTVRADYGLKLNWKITNSSIPLGPQNPDNLSTTFVLGKNDSLTYWIKYE